MKSVPLLVAALTLAACSGSAPSSSSSTAPPPTDPASTARITGRVVIEGQVPAPEMIRLDGDPNCAAMEEGARRPAEDVVVGPGNTLQNTFVYLKDGLPARIYPVPAEPVVLDQQGCRYVPHVLGVQVGQELTVRNSDALLHNVRAESAINEPFDVGTPVKGMEVKRTFVTREVMVPVKCNVHPWMSAFIGVLEHPFFDVSDSGGTFSIAQVPPGTYTIEVWHERFGTQAQQVTVRANETSDVTFTYKAS